MIDYEAAASRMYTGPALTKPAAPETATILGTGGAPAPKPEPTAEEQMAARLFQGPKPEGEATAPQSAPEPAAESSVYDTMPEDDANYAESTFNHAGEVQSDILPGDLLPQMDPAEVEQFREALVAGGAGSTTARQVMTVAEGYMRGTAEPMTMEAGRAALEQRFGRHAAAKVAAAQEVIAKASAKWPGLVGWLEETGAGNDPRLIEKLAARASKMPRR